jgi:hypothetical protein
MKRLIYFVFLFSLISVACSKDDNNSPIIDEILTYDTPNRDTIPAFPGAEGGGMFTKGGAEGEVYIVKYLDDTLERGTLRFGIESLSGPRTIVFSVGGEIILTRPLIIRNGNLTIAGQTAPGGGITIRNSSVIVDADNVIIRFLRFRMGDVVAREGDAIEGQGRRNIIIDHCSMSWGTDEVASFYDNTNFTMQWCIISESLNNSVHPKGAHGYGGIWGGKTASFHHNLIAHHKSRTPRMCGSRYSNNPAAEKVDFRNNVIYNWGDANGAHAGEGGSYNLVNNYYKPGPMTVTKNQLTYRIFQANGDDGSNRQPVGVWGVFFVQGNKFDKTAAYLSATNISDIDKVNADNSYGFHTSGVLPSGGLSAIVSEVEFDITYVTTHSAEVAYKKVLSFAGASLIRDDVDVRIVKDVKDGTFTANGSNGSINGIIDSQQDVGGWPQLSTGESPLDSDGDGMPDAWEIANGLDPNDSSDSRKYNLSAEYTNLEVYLNSLVSEGIGFGN